MTWKKPVVVEQPVALEAAAYVSGGYGKSSEPVASHPPPVVSDGTDR